MSIKQYIIDSGLYEEALIASHTSTRVTKRLNSVLMFNRFMVFPEVVFNVEQDEQIVFTSDYVLEAAEYYDNL